MEFQNYTTHQSDWISFLIIAVVFVFGILHFNGAFQLKSVLSSLASGDPSSKDFKVTANFLLNVNTLAILGLFIYSGLAYVTPLMELDYLVFLRIVFGVLILIAFQRLAIQLHSVVTNTVRYFKNYLSIQNQFAHLAAILSLPLLILSLYSTVLNQVFLIAGATVFGGVYLFGILKSIASSNRIKGPLKFHLIFYLCGNEILPFFLFYKILI